MTSVAAAELVDLVGSEGVEEEAGARWAVAGTTPLATVSPSDEHEVAQVIRWAADRGVAVVPTGGGHALVCGPPPPRPVIVLSTRRMTALDGYEPADLTLTAGAGVTLGALARRLGEHGQWIPLDPPGAPGRSLGGVVMAGRDGPLGASFGAPRDLVLGLTVVTGKGDVLRLGGRVVKNVAGFDLVKLMVGSRGTLGVATSVSLRVYPLPAADRVLLLRADRAEELLPVARAVATASVLPAAVDVVEPSPEGGAALVVRLLGAEGAVHADGETLKAETSAHFEPVSGARAEQLVEAARDAGTQGRVVLRLTALPEDVSVLVGLARGLQADGAPELAVGAASGVVRASLALGGTAVDDVARALGDTFSHVERMGGSFALVHAPTTVLRRLAAAREDGEPGALVAGLKRTFDPACVLSPGRFAA